MNFLSINRRAAVRALAGGVLALAASAQAQDFQGPIRVLVGYPPGGPADAAARIVASKLATVLNQPLVVENRPGAGGQIAAKALKAAPADGSVLFMSNVHTVATVPLTMAAPGFDPVKDFRTVGAVSTFELALAAHTSTNANTVAELGQWFAAHRSQASLGVPAPASAPEFLGMRVMNSFKAETVPVPYKGAAPMVQDLLGGTLPAGVSGVSDFLQYHQSGRLRILAVTRATPLLPGVPSFAEAGMPGLELTDFLGLYAPAATPLAVVARYNQALNQVLAMPDVVEKFQSLVMTVVPGTPQAQAERLARTTRTLAELVRSSGYKPQ
jgi:tripartite-type tricarboxylate transporter receptor subunit TctC